MGVHLKRTYALRWDVGHHLEEVEIDIRSTSAGTLREVRELRSTSEGELRLAEILAGHIERWNLDDADGQPLPITADGLYLLESAVLREIAKQWHLAAAGVSAPLEPRSTSSAPSAEASIPMETS
jgi:hypothetical protein